MKPRHDRVYVSALFRWLAASSTVRLWRLTASCTRLVMATMVDLVLVPRPTRSFLNESVHWTAFTSAMYVVFIPLCQSVFGMCLHIFVSFWQILKYFWL